jgi:multidrug resistance efflux pump
MQNEVKEAQRNSLTESLPKIPTPPGTRWREVRFKYVPLIVFLGTALLIWQFWTNLPPSTGVRGIGEGAVSILASPADGYVQNVTVGNRGHIEAGEPVATIVPFDPRARMDLFQAQLQISRLALEPTLIDRNAVNYEQLRFDALRLKSQLEMARQNLKSAETFLPRHEALLKERLISQDVYEATLRDRNLYRAEVEETTKALKQIEERMEQLRPIAESAAGGTNLLQAMLPQLEEQMNAVGTNWNPVTLSAPISGEVSLIRQAHEFVRLGEPLLTISSERSDKIVAYLKQPIPFEPQVGMQVEVVTRTRKPLRFVTEVAQIGARVEVITNAIAYLPAGAIVDSGLPVILSVPPDIQVRPGEIVDVEWRLSGRTEKAVRRLLGKR